MLAGRSLTAVLQETLHAHPDLGAGERGALTDLCYGALRHYGELDAVLALLRPAHVHPLLRSLLLVALYQLVHTRAAAHAVVDHAVSCAAALKQPRAKALVNAVLRTFLRRRAELVAQAGASPVGRYSHPQWWIDKLRQQHPDDYRRVLEIDNQRPPMTLRVNRRATSPADYLALLAAHGLEARALGGAAIMLNTALPVERLPGFVEGKVSVQDAAAQHAAPLLDVADGMRVLDACSAPGGKATHLLELADIELLALDRDGARVQRLQQNLARLALRAEVKIADVLDTAQWWNGRAFDRVLCDAPCSASGVVRRHPDIKWLRRRGDIEQFARVQAAMLDALWRTLASGGKLLYATCSVFDEENRDQAARFVERHPDAKRLTVAIGQARHGQLLPDTEHDGFFYALFAKD